MQTRTSLRDLRAADLMQRDLVTVNVDDPLREVERLLVDAQISSVPVLDDAGVVLGVVSMRDVVSRYAAKDDQPDVDEPADGDPFDWELPGDEPCAADVMGSEMVRVGPNTRLAAMARLMVENATHRVLVVDGDRLLGLVSTMDVLRALADHGD